MEPYQEIIKSIVQAQLNIIGPMAIDEANKVEGLHIENNFSTISIQGDESSIIEKLITQYAVLFGSISVEVSKEAVQKIVKEKNHDIVLPAIVR
jgi:hypothetical protein